MTKDRASLTKAFSLVLAVALVLAGGLVAVLASGRAERLISGLGLGLMVVGIESFFRSATLFRFEREERSKEIVIGLRQVLLEAPLGAHGIRLVEDRRRGCSEYYNWVMSDERQELFFAGRSVLHRIDDDLKARGLKSAEHVITRRVKEGAKIRILFLNPASDIVGRIAFTQSANDGMKSRSSQSGCTALQSVISGTNPWVPADLFTKQFDANSHPRQKRKIRLSLVNNEKQEYSF